MQPDAPLAPLTWFNLGGPAKYLVRPDSVEQLQKIVTRLAEAEIPMYVLGSGANLLVRDEGVNGAVIHLSHAAFKNVAVNEHLLTVGAGMDVQKLLRHCTHHGLSGLECLAGIPGSVGGEIRMNAGGAFGDIGSNVRTVTVMDAAGRIYQRTRDDLLFSYRKTNISAKFVLEAAFDLTPEEPQNILSRVKEIWMYKKNSQPLADKSAGCIFKNADGKSAGALIDQAGLKGATVGGAEVSGRHANFIVARPGATASDVFALIAKIQKAVAEKFGVNLETEVVIW